MGSVSDFFTEIDFNNFLWNLWSGGWYEYVFPFLLVYAVVFTILKQVTLFQNKQAIKVIIALTFAFFSISFPITGEGENCVLDSCGRTIADLMMALFPGVTAFSIGVLGLYIVAAMLGVDLKEFFGDPNKNQYVVWVLGALGTFVVIYYFALGYGWQGFDSSNNWFWGVDGILRDPLLYIITLFGLFFWWVSKDDLENP